MSIGTLSAPSRNGHAYSDSYVEYAALPTCEDVEAERFAIGCLLQGYDDDRLHDGLFPPGIRRVLFDSLCTIKAEGMLVGPQGDSQRQLQVAATQNSQRVVVFAEPLWSGGAGDLRRELSLCLCVATLPELLDHHVERLEHVARERRLRDALQAGIESLNDPHADRDELVANLVESVQWSDRPVRTSPMSLGSLRESHAQLRPGIIDGLMREGETVNLIAPPKVGKSWMAMDLALTVATGGRWLDRHQTVCGRVLYIDNELHPETLSHRIASVAYARGIPPEDIADRIDVLTLRGRLTDIHGLATMLSHIEPGTYSIVVLDAMYRMLPAGASENDNAGMAAVYNALDSIAGRMRCGIVLVHHSSKGLQSGKSVTDVGSGAGSQSRAADAHLVLREHDEEGCYVMDAVVRSWAPPEPLVLRWEFPVWMPADELDPTRLRQAQTAGDARQQQRDREGMDAILGALDGGPQTRHQLRQLCGFGFDRINRLIARLIDSGEARLTYSEGNADLIERGGL